MPILAANQSSPWLRKLVPCLGLLAFGMISQIQAADTLVQFIITSDVHFGFTRKYPVPHTTGTTNAITVNSYEEAAMNTVSAMTYPSDGGVGAGGTVGPIDMICITGDMANRWENGAPASQVANEVQTDAASWANFQAGYLSATTGITLVNKNGVQPPFLLTPGNHDISNAIGQQYVYPADIDDTSMRWFISYAQGTPGTLLPAGTVTQAFFQATNSAGAFKNKPNYSVNFGGIHFVSISAWPDTGTRAWIDADLGSVPLTTPVMIFTHCYPDVDGALLAPPSSTSPYSYVPGPPTTTAAPCDLEAVASDVIAQSEYTTYSANPSIAIVPTAVEQTALETWIKSHPNIVAYFHGHTNFNEMYQYNGPLKDISLNCFRLDSPMKGQLSSAAYVASSPPPEGLLSFQLATVDMTTGKMTVREIRYWNTTTAAPQAVFSTDTTTPNPDTGLYSTFSATNTPIETVPLFVSAPTFSVAGGSYTSAQTVALACATPNTTIYYTDNGLTPTNQSTLYTGPITISSTTTLQAIAVTDSFSSLAPATASATYTLSGVTTATTGSTGSTGTTTAATTTGSAATSTSSSDNKCGAGGGLGVLLGLALIAGSGLLRRRKG